MNILAQIVADKRLEIARRAAAVPLVGLRAAAASRPAPPAFVAALRAAPIGLIAEVKRRSPSAGLLREPFDPAAIARAYAAGGAQALSVLIDEKYFGGGEADFRAVRAAVALPLLYKEFVVAPWQLWHAASLGASAVLLIAAVLGDPELAEFIAMAEEARLTALVEVHDAAELQRAVAARARCLGVNNRDLRTFVTSLDTTRRLVASVPAGCTLVSESGIRTAAEVQSLRGCGVHAVLVGEQLLRQPDLTAAVRTLMRPS